MLSSGVFRYDQADILGSLGGSPSCSPYLRSPPPPVVKLTWGELQASVELLAKKRRNVKRKAQDPPESSLPAQGKASKLGVSVPRSPVKERGSHAQVRVRGQALPSLAEVAVCAVSLILYCKR